MEIELHKLFPAKIDHVFGPDLILEGVPIGQTIIGIRSHRGTNKTTTRREQVGPLVKDNNVLSLVRLVICLSPKIPRHHGNGSCGMKVFELRRMIRGYGRFSEIKRMIEGKNALRIFLEPPEKIIIQNGYLGFSILIKIILDNIDKKGHLATSKIGCFIRITKKGTIDIIGNPRTSLHEANPCIP